jgi:hypothetical protein
MTAVAGLLKETRRTDPAHEEQIIRMLNTAPTQT